MLPNVCSFVKQVRRGTRGGGFRTKVWVVQKKG